MLTTEIVYLAAASLIAGGFKLLHYWLRLRFLRRTFERNGDRRDLEVAGRAARGTK